MTETPERLIIKNAFITVNEYFMICIIAFLTGFAIYEKVSIISFLSLFTIVLSAHLVYGILKRLKNKKPQIVIDKKGIELCDENQIYPWKKIQYAYIKPITTGSGKSSKTIEYLFIITPKGTIKKALNDYKYSEKQIKTTIEYFSGRDIAEAQCQFRDEVYEILGNNKFSKEIMQEFSRFKTKWTITGVTVFFGLLALSIYLQIIYFFRFSLGCGFVLAIVASFLFTKMQENELRQERYISDLSDETFDKLGYKYEVKYTRKQMNEFKIFFGVVAAIIFVVTYFATI